MQRSRIEAKINRFTGSSELGILVLHGFTSNTDESMPIAQPFIDKGFSVSVPLLPGHGTTPRDLAKRSWKDWISAAQEEIQWLKSRAERVVIGGSSMGGVISLYLAGTNKIDGVFTLGTPYRLPKWIEIGAKLYGLLGKHVKKDEGTLNYYRKVGLTSYNTYPGPSLRELTRLFVAMRRVLPNVSAPYSGHIGMRDNLVLKGEANKILTAIKSKIAMITYYRRSSHILIKEPDAELVMKNVSQFISSLLE